MDAKDKIIALLTKENAALRAYIVKLEARLAVLERRLGLNSSNSSKPPSSDGLKKENTIPKSQLKQSKQSKNKRHHQEQMRQVANPDHVIAHLPKVCSGCGASLKDVASDGCEKRQVFDLPVPKLEVTEHQLHRKICHCCGTKNYGSAPAGVVSHVAYGPRILGAALYLSNIQLLPYHRVAALLQALYGANICEQTIITAEKQLAASCASKVVTIEQHIRAALVVHADETGIRVNGSLHWMFSCNSSFWVKFWVAKKRGEVMKDLSCFLVRDCFKPYDTYNPLSKMALCNAHILRDLAAVTTLDKQPWAAKMQRILCLMNNIKNRYKQGAIPLCLVNKALERYDKILVAAHQKYIVAEQGSYRAHIKSRKGKALALLRRLMVRNMDVLRFFYEAEVPFTNNEAERCLRMNKVKQKISGCFRKLAGAERFAAIRSVALSLQKQHANIFKSFADFFATGEITFPLTQYPQPDK